MSYLDWLQLKNFEKDGEVDNYQLLYTIQEDELKSENQGVDIYVF